MLYAKILKDQYDNINLNVIFLEASAVHLKAYILFEQTDIIFWI